MKWETAAADHVGGRGQQQDRVGVLSSRDDGRRLLVVADGMGGHTGGALAAQVVVDTAEKIWRDGAAEATGKDLLARICSASHEAINAVGGDRKLSPRSTAVLLFLDGDTAHWAHIGDSRLYHFRDGKLVERSQDHSVVQMLVDIGKISEREMGTHPDQNRLTQSLGGDGDPEPSFGEAEVGDSDAFLLCSDGLWEMVTPEEMAEALSESSLDRAARRLSELAVERAGENSDNVSVAVARPGIGARAAGGVPRSWLAFALVGVAALIAAMLVVFAFDTDPEVAAPADPSENGRTIPNVPEYGGEPEPERRGREPGDGRSGSDETEDGGQDGLEERAIIPEREGDGARPGDEAPEPGDRDDEVQPPERPNFRSGEPDAGERGSPGDSPSEEGASGSGLDAEPSPGDAQDEDDAETEGRPDGPSGPLQGE